jgi:hypothetical protein
MDLIDLQFRDTEMTDLSLKSAKCRAVRGIRCHQGMVSTSTEGTIQYEFDNFGRRLINVRWNNGIRVNVFPEEIEIIDRDLLSRQRRCYQGASNQ